MSRAYAENRKNKTGEMLFFAVLIPLLAVLILYTTTFYESIQNVMPLIRTVMMFLSPCLVLVKIFLFDDMSKMRKIISAFLIMIIVCQSMYVSQSDILCFSFVCLMGAYGIDHTKILKVYLIESASFVVLMTAASLVNIIPNYVYIQYGMTRNSLGNRYCTDYASRIFFLLLIVLYLYGKRMKIYHWIGLAVLMVAAFAATFAKLDFICMVLALAIFFADVKMSSAKKENAFVRFWNNMWEKLAPVFVPAAAAIMAILTLLYDPDSGIMAKINSILSGRLYYGKAAFSDIGVTLFGQYVKWISNGGSAGQEVYNYNFVDCSYLKIMFDNGVFVALAVVAVWAFFAYKHRMNRSLIIVTALVALNCMIAHHLVELEYNPFTLIMIAAVPVIPVKAKR